MLRLFRMCIGFMIYLEGDIQILLVYWNHIDGDIQVVRVDGESYG